MSRLLWGTQLEGNRKKHVSIIVRFLWQMATASLTTCNTLRFSFFVWTMSVSRVSQHSEPWPEWSSSCKTWEKQSPWSIHKTQLYQPGFLEDQVVGHLPQELLGFANYIIVHVGITPVKVEAHIYYSLVWWFIITGRAWASSTPIGHCTKQDLCRTSRYAAKSSPEIARYRILMHS